MSKQQEEHTEMEEKMKITQVHLTNAQRAAAMQIGRECNVSMAEVIRQALTLYLAQRQATKEAVQ